MVLTIGCLRLMTCRLHGGYFGNNEPFVGNWARVSVSFSAICLQIMKYICFLCFYSDFATTYNFSTRKKWTKSFSQQCGEKLYTNGLQHEGYLLIFQSFSWKMLTQIASYYHHNTLFHNSQFGFILDLTNINLIVY